MNNTIISIIAGALAVTGTVAALYYIRRNNLKKKIAEVTEQIEDKLQFDEVVSYLRSLNLNKNIDTPFIANCHSDQFRKLTKGYLHSKPGYDLLMIGTHNNQTNEITNYKFIYSLGWSEDLIQIMGNESVVVLS